MYPRKFKAQMSKIKNIEKSFTLIEVVVVMGILGLIIGGLLVSLRQIIESETMLKKMQSVEEETRFIMDAFAQDAEYSELNSAFKPATTDGDIFAYKIKFILVGKQSEIISGGNMESEYSWYDDGKNNYFLKRAIKDPANPSSDTAATLNNTPFMAKPVFRVKLVKSPDEAENYFITLSVVYKVVNKTQIIHIPVQTSAISRTFEF